METYFGGKGSPGVYQTIINHIPPHKTYIEGFLGLGRIFWNKKPAAESILIDKDESVFFHAVPANPQIEVEHIRGDFMKLARLEYLKKLLSDPNTFAYLDPPYPLASRKSQKLVYKHEMTDAQHRELLALITAPWVKAQIMISSYPNEMYDKALAGWQRVTFQGWSRTGPTEEVIYMNYELGAELHDYSHLGEDYREREKYRKRARRMVAKLHRLPEVERLHLLSAIVEEFGPITL